MAKERRPKRSAPARRQRLQFLSTCNSFVCIEFSYLLIFFDGSLVTPALRSVKTTHCGFVCGLTQIVAVAATLGCTAKISGGGGSSEGANRTNDSSAGPNSLGGSSTGVTPGASGVGSTTGGASGVAPTATGGTGGSVTSGTPSSAGSGTGGSSTGSSSEVFLPGAPLYSRFLRLTNEQWEHSVDDILKLSAPTGLSEDFLHAVAGTTDFDNNERVVIVNDTVWSDFRNAAETVAAQVTATDADLQNVVATTDAITFITTFGRRAFRRDLTDDEVNRYKALYDEGPTYSGSQSDFTKGAGLVITAMLQSPNFLYRSEMGDAGTPLTGYEMAAKLSLWIRDTTPTDAMLDAAASGAFDTADGAASQATQMLDDPAALAVMRKFHGELYKIELMDTIVKTGVQGYTEALTPEFKEASYLFFDRIFSQNLGIQEMLTTNVGFAGPEMATIYGVSVQGSGIEQVDLPDRAGFYSQAPFLTLWAINNDPDSIHRGVRINLDTLCADPGSPVANIPPVPALEPDQTNRERYEALTMGCGDPCHSEIINPVGFAFENFDGLGRYRDMDNGKLVDTTGSYTFAEGTMDFSGAPELMQLIANGTQAHQCYAKKMASYALERDIVDGERPLVESLGQTSLASGASLKELMLALVKNDAFRTHVGGAP